MLLGRELNGGSSVLGTGDSDFKNISKLFRSWPASSTLSLNVLLGFNLCEINSNFASSAWLSKMIRPRKNYIFIFSFYHVQQVFQCYEWLWCWLGTHTRIFLYWNIIPHLFNKLQYFIIVLNVVTINPPLVLTSSLQLCYGISKTVLKSNDSKFYNVNRNTSKVGKFLELYCYLWALISPHNRLHVLHTIAKIQAVSKVCHHRTVHVTVRTTT